MTPRLEYLTSAALLFAAHVWHAVVRDVEGSQHYCNEIMDRLMEAAS